MLVIVLGMIEFITSMRLSEFYKAFHINT